MNGIFKACGTALVTPFLENGEVDYSAFEALLERQCRGGVDFLVPLATTSETPTLSSGEKHRLLNICKGCGLPLLAGCGSNSVNATLENIKAFPGADAYLVVVPFYNKPTQEGLYLYFKTIARESGVPIIMYNVPGRTGCNMTADTCLRIAREVPGIIGVKEASGNFGQCRQILEGAPEGFSLFSGDDDMTFSLMKEGAAGVISVASNILPQQVSTMVKLCLEGDFEKAEELDSRLQPLFKGCFVESNPIPAKEALRQLGLCSNTMRIPLTAAGENTVRTIKEILSEWK